MTEIIERVVHTPWGPSDVAAYLLDFSHAEEWDAGTVSCTRTGGDGGVGTRYRNVSQFPATSWGKKTSLDYEVTAVDPEGGFVIEGRNKTVTSKDFIAVRPQVGGGSTVHYRAEMTFHGPSRYAVPVLRPFLKQLGDHTAAQLDRVLREKARTESGA